MLEFASFTKDELAEVATIVQRTKELFKRQGRTFKQMDCHMDIAAVHNTCPLDLKAFAAANPLNFAHDAVGIHNHLNRRTGELNDYFLPRFAKR